MMPIKLGACLCAVILAAKAIPALAEDRRHPSERYEQLVRSDVPLWGFEHPELWPKSISDDGPLISFGCRSPVAFGDWNILRDDDDSEASWLRLTNYGVFHCALIHQASDERGSLAGSQGSYAFAVRIGSFEKRSKSIELWALQIGVLGGSEYMLLSREPSEDIITRFKVLQRRCRSQHIRRGPSLDIFGTEYCAINSKGEMIAFAKRMAGLPPLGTMEWRGEDGQEEIGSD